MIKHIVLWMFREATDADAAAAQIKQRLEGLVGVVPGLLSAQAGRGFCGWDMALVTTHESRAALEAYQCHPAHLVVKEYVHSVVCERVFCDFEV